MKQHWIILCLGFGWTVVTGQIINVEDKRNLKADTVSWHERVDLGINLYKNTETIISFNAAAQIQFAFKNKLLLSITSGTFVQAGDNDFVNEGFQHLRYNSDINNWLTFELFGQVQFNELARIKIRALGGTGLRFTILEIDKNRMHLGLSYMYEYDEERTMNITNEDSRLNTYLSFYLKPTGFLTLASTTYYQPLFRKFRDFRLSSTTSASFSFNDRLAFKSKFNIAYDSRASVGAPKTIYSLTNGLTYEF